MNKKMGYNKELDYHKQLKLMKFLTYRGFTRDQIEKAKYLLSDNNSTDINEDK
jgi:SOS response regulatory protein OraA/RecX